MQQYAWVALVTLLFGFGLFGMSLVVSRYRVTQGIVAPATSGDPRFERAFRAHANTLEWSPIFLPAMWIFAAYCSATWAAALGAVWVVGRVAYFIGYVANPEKRLAGMSIQAAATLALSLGALERILYLAL